MSSLRLREPRSSRLWTRCILTPLLLIGWGLTSACHPRRAASDSASVEAPTTADRRALTATGDWPTLKAEREAAYRDYLLKGNPKAFDWFHSKPLGLQGLPWIVMQVILGMYPDIWAGSEAGESNKLGMGPHPEDFITASGQSAWFDWGTRLKAPTERHGLPYGFESYPDLTGDPATIPQTQNTFFSCAACHTSRIVTQMGGKPAIRYYLGGANSEIEGQLFAGLLLQTVSQLTTIDTEADPAKIVPKEAAVNDFVARLASFDCRLYKPNRGADGLRECQEEKLRILGPTLLQKFNITVGASKLDLAQEEKERAAMQLVQEHVVAVTGAKAPDIGCAAKPADPKAEPLTKLLKQLVASGYKVKVMYMKLGINYPFRPAGVPSNNTNQALRAYFLSEQAKTPPPLFGPRPGQMDAFGLVQGVAYLNALRPDYLMFRFMSPSYFSSKLGGSPSEADRELGQALAGSPDAIQKSACATGNWAQNVGNWYTQAAALSDIKSLYRSSDEKQANWDGNEGAGARVLASGLSSVGDPSKVFTEIHETANAFIDQLPAPPYPFEDATSPDFYQSALRGQALFNEEKSCARCHKAESMGIFNVGTDLNRASAVWAPETRLGLIALTMAACEAGKNRVQSGAAWIKSELGSDGLYWCEKIGGQKPENMKTYMEDIFRPIRGGVQSKQPLGYKADMLYGIWGDAPYLHNGSVPTLREMLMSRAERMAALAKRGDAQRFIRGNLVYDQENGGFLATAPKIDQYVEGDNLHYGWFDVSQRGNSNAGHEFFHKEYVFDETSRTWVGKAGTEFSESEKWDVVHYLKLK